LTKTHDFAKIGKKEKKREKVYYSLWLSRGNLGKAFIWILLKDFPIQKGGIA